MAVTVCFKSGSNVMIASATKVEHEGFPYSSADPSTNTAAGIVLKDDSDAIIGRFRQAEIAGWFIHSGARGGAAGETRGGAF